MISEAIKITSPKLIVSRAIFKSMNLCLTCCKDSDWNWISLKSESSSSEDVKVVPAEYEVAGIIVFFSLISASC